MKYDKVGVQKWYVVFTDADHNYPFKRFLKKGFTHCYAILDEYDYYVRVDPVRCGLIVDKIQKKETNIAQLIHQEDPAAKIIGLEHQLNEDNNLFWSPINCVSIVNYCLGIKHRRFKIFTPFQLYKYLIKRPPDQKFYSWEIFV